MSRESAMRPAAPIDFYFLIIITIVRLTSWFPYRPVRLAVAGVLSGLSYHLSLGKRAAMKHAITTAFGDQLDTRELTRILKGSLFDIWWEILGTKPNNIDAVAIKNAQIIGWNHMEEALAAGKGVILWENGNFGRRFWAKQILHREGVHVHQIRGENHLGVLKVDNANATWVRRCVIRPFFDDPEKPYVAELIVLPSTGHLAYGRRLLQILRRNAIICVAADGESGTKVCAVPFLGAWYPFSTGMVSLARMSGAMIVPMLCLESDVGNPCLIFAEAIRVSEDDDRERQTEKIISGYAGWVEQYIRRDPGTYRSWHLVPRIHKTVTSNKKHLLRDTLMRNPKAGASL